ncbi:MAG: sigma-E factor negative regulatory protein [Gammaproteobacteria bacterium]|nr:sigma-E factor negative regulatory protein [Gammaproteobacteria bacterium]MBI5614745.1 sigma-E factor negative regulatory protein [Gammaproteobacteria bacterium]
MQDLERLSALVDDAASGDEAFLKNIAGTPGLRAAWGRYHLIGEVLRDAHTGAPGTSFADRVRDAVAAEPTVLAPRVRPRRSSLRHPLAAGLALAASIAALAIVTLRPATVDEAGVAANGGFTAAPSQVVFVQPRDAAPATNAEDPEYAQREGADQFQRRLSSYLVNFNEQRSNLGVPGVHPYVRIVDFQSDSNRQ